MSETDVRVPPSGEQLLRFIWESLVDEPQGLLKSPLTRAIAKRHVDSFMARGKFTETELNPRSSIEQDISRYLRKEELPETEWLNAAPGKAIVDRDGYPVHSSGKLFKIKEEYAEFRTFEELTSFVNARSVKEGRRKKRDNVNAKETAVETIRPRNKMLKDLIDTDIEILAYLHVKDSRSTESEIINYLFSFRRKTKFRRFRSLFSRHASLGDSLKRLTSLSLIKKEGNTYGFNDEGPAHGCDVMDEMAFRFEAKKANEAVSDMHK